MLNNIKKFLEGVIFMQNRNDFIEKLLDRAQIEEGMRVLDIGCATGEVTQLIAKRVGRTVKSSVLM